MSLKQNNKKMKMFITVVSFISIILLTFFSPAHALMWLVFSSLCLMFMGNSNFIYIIWIISFSFLYFVFIFTLSENPFFIGFKNTQAISAFLIQSNARFAKLCFQTVVLLDQLGISLGFFVYFPVLISIIKIVLDFFEQKTR